MTLSEMRLGLRLAVADGRRSAVGLVLTALAVAIGTAVLLFAVSFQPALADRNSRSAWRDAPLWTGQDMDNARLLMARYDDKFEGQTFVRILLAPTAGGSGYAADAPVPPGIPALPGPGQAYVSPALAALLASTPADELAPRIGTVVGIIGPEALRSPQELVAIIGTENDKIGYASPIISFATSAAGPEVPPLGLLILMLAVVGALVPVAVFVATATRLAATRRERRLAALRLVGATPAQVSRLAVVEALLYTAIGAPAGILVFLLIRPFVAWIPLDGASWWPDSIVPPLSDALILLIVVQIVGASAALAGMRRLSLSPLGVQRRTTPSPPSVLRLAPTAIGIGALIASLAFFRSSMGDTGPLVVIGASFAAIIGGIAVAGPWLTVVVGRVLGRVARGPSMLLAGRRLADDPSGSFGSIAGVIMAVFVASVFFTMAAYAAQQAGSYVAPMRTSSVMAIAATGPENSQIVAKLAGVSGVKSVVAVREVSLSPTDGVTGLIAWIAPCGDVLAALDLPTAACGSAGIHINVPPDRTQPESYSVAWFNSEGMANVGLEFRPKASQLMPLMPAYTAIDGLPDAIIDPEVFAADITATGSGASNPAAWLAALPVSRVYATTDGSVAARERVRAASQGAAPTALVVLPEDQVSRIPQMAEVSRIVDLGLLGSLLLAGCSLAVATMTGLLERRREYTFLRAAGMPVARLRALVLLQAGVPLVVVSAFSALLGVVVTQAILRVADAPSVPLPDISIVWLLGASLAAAMLVVAATLPAVDGLTKPTSLRNE
jgi:cell division protein FtsX